MGDQTTIEWTDATWNPTVGCTKVSPGCDHCYAETFVNRFAGTKGFPLPFDQILLRTDRFIDLPRTWREPRKVFVNSLSDLFHAEVPDEFIVRVFQVMAETPRHTYQLLTKRHGRMRAFLTEHQSEPPPNVWIGVSVEDQRRAHLRLPALLQTPAAVRWVSAEPLLGMVSIAPWLGAGDRGDNGLDWVVAGGESGPGSRPMHPDWARLLRDQCALEGVAFLFKQWGNWAPIPDEHARGTDLSLNFDGTSVELEEALSIRGAAFMRNVGKKTAGRLLDGQTYDGYPQVVAA